MMTVGNIIKAVRWCIDEEATNTAGIADVSAYDFDSGTHTDQGLMNNIIRNKIPDALRWLCLHAPAWQLSGGTAVSDASPSASTSIDLIQEDELTANGNILTPTKTLVRVIRVKGTGWHKAILGDSLIKEDSDKYLQTNDVNGAAPTADRPQAALVNTKEKTVEVFPSTGTFKLTYVTTLSSNDITSLGNDDTEVGVPDLVVTSFVYYLAFLLLTAYGDSRAKSMFDVANLYLGK